jgi:23S rRNA (cytosine1962-C5)-methyltransferase
LWGELPPASLIVKESGFDLAADVFAGQKTGLFLDHRENRRYVETISAGLRVLNLFSYTGAFSLYAARGGATEVVSVDLARAAGDAAAQNLRTNGFDPALHPIVARDVFEYLAENTHERFDIIICDPPSFARNKRQAKRAIAAYIKVNQAALGLLADGGILASASCTTQVGVEDFRGALVQSATRAKKRLQIIHEAGQPLDHPVSLGHPEGRYLKFVVCRVRELF